MEEKINVFIKNLEENYIFDIKQNTINSGASDLVSYETICTTKYTNVNKHENKYFYDFKKICDNCKIMILV